MLQNGELGTEHADIFSCTGFYLSLIISNTKFCGKKNTIGKISPDLKTPSVPEDQSFVQNLRTTTSAMEGIQRD